MLKLKLQYFGHLVWMSWLIWKDSDAQKDWRQEEKGMTEDEMAGWHHWLDGHESGWTLGVGDGQGGLACCGSWGRKESDMTERLIWSEKDRHLKICLPPTPDPQLLPSWGDVLPSGSSYIFSKYIFRRTVEHVYIEVETCFRSTCSYRTLGLEGIQFSS